MIAEKTGKGYREETGAATASPSAGDPADDADDGAPAAPATTPAAAKAAAPGRKAAPAPAAPKATVAAPKPAAAAPKPAADPSGWLDAGGGYQLALRDGALVCRNAKGKELSSVPSKIADGPVGEQLSALAEWLADHAADCRASVEAWMLRSLPVPVALVAAVWPDPAWRAALENCVVRPADALGGNARGEPGFLRGADPGKGFGVVTIDGETRWQQGAALTIPHPVLLSDRDEWRQLAGDLDLRQGVQQLLRETFARDPAVDADDARAVRRFAGGEFEQLNHVLGRCRQLGYAVRGGNATCLVIVDGTEITAAYWIGADSPDGPTVTGDLEWTDHQGRALTVSEVPAVAFSEGVRMAAAIHAKRKVAEQAGA